MEKGMIILLVDDDEDDRNFFAEAANEVDPAITFVGASSAREALRYLQNDTNALPDLIFLDLRMPGLSGKDCLAAIKSDSRLAAVPVIVYTTSREVEESIELKKLGASHFMSKPTSPDEIYYMLSVVLGENWK